MFDLDNLVAEPNEFRVCDKCKATNINTLMPKLKEVDSDALIYIGCHSYCGPGRDRNFAFVNNKPILANSEDELIEKIKEYLNN